MGHFLDENFKKDFSVPLEADVLGHGAAFEGPFVQKDGLFRLAVAARAQEPLDASVFFAVAEQASGGFLRAHDGHARRIL